MKLRVLSLGLGLALAAAGCRKSAPSKQDTRPQKVEAGEAEPEPEPEAEAETGDPLSGEKAHVIPFADRTSMGYLLLLESGTERPETPSREYLQTLVQQAFPERRGAGELDLLINMIGTSPHATDLGFNGELEPPEELAETGAGAGAMNELGPEELEKLAAEAGRERSFDLIGLHIELIRLGVGDSATIPTSAYDDPVLTRELDEAQRASLLGRQWALLLRADYRNLHAVRGLRLLQTLVRVAAEHYGALIHDPDTLETMDVEAFTERRLRAEAGNVADQIAIVPFPDAHDDSLLRLSTRGMRRFGSVDLELGGLEANPQVLQRASDLIAGLALALAREAEVDVTGFAVEIPKLIEVDCELIRQSYSARDYAPACSGSVLLHLVERPPEPHDPREHVVARIVAPRAQSDEPDYDHPQWVRAALAKLFADAPARPSLD